MFIDSICDIDAKIITSVEIILHRSFCLYSHFKFDTLKCTFDVNFALSFENESHGKAVFKQKLGQYFNSFEQKFEISEIWICVCEERETHP